MKKIFLIAALLIIFIFPLKVNAAANWIWVYSDDYISIWIDNNSIGRDNSGFFAYFKWTYSDAGRDRAIENMRSDGLSVNGYHNLSESKYFYYFKSSGGIKYVSLMGFVDYDKNGKILDSFSRNNFNWQRVIPDTVGEEMYDAVWARVRGK